MPSILAVWALMTTMVMIARRPPVELSTGRYLYCGSANGPGGPKARVTRHARHGKSMRWHVDQLTEHGTITGICIARHGRECDLVAMLAPLPMPIPGFGSSDCARCWSHLLALPSGARPSAVQSA
jgi:Uri superfamily endonuclease